MVFLLSIRPMLLYWLRLVHRFKKKQKLSQMGGLNYNFDSRYLLLTINPI
jgi:hypothetical protein